MSWNIFDNFSAKAEQNLTKFHLKQYLNVFFKFCVFGPMRKPRWSPWCLIGWDIFLFSSPEPKARVSYCHSAPSVVRPSVRRPSVVRKLSHFRLLLQNRLMDFDETWYGRSTHGPLQVLLFFGQIRPGADPGRGKNRSRGPLLQETSSSVLKATATTECIAALEACGKKCCYFWFHSEVKFWCVFDVFLDSVILPYFNAISMDLYAVKCLIYIYFVLFPCL